MPPTATASTAPEAEAPAEGETAIEVTVVDQNGKNPASIPVAIEGPEVINALTDPRGRVRQAAAPGNYSVYIPAGCTNILIVEFGGQGSLGVAPKQTARAKLETTWKHRFGPDGAAYSSEVPYWIVGHEITVTYEVVDRCDQVKARGASFPTYRFETSPNVEVIGEPVMSSDANAQATVKVRCNSAGRAELTVFDSKNLPDRIDLTSQISGSQVECRHD
ncbi:MAG TPA: hypothetical protein VND22_01300 [Actinomycetota bacterium]|nr:hypothetical protein [Actinomycetota bacterium]